MPAATMEKESVKVIGANGQISLGKKYAGRQVVVEEWEPGVWHVRTAKVVPDNESWLDAKALQDIQDGLAWALATPPDSSTTEAILQKLRDSL